MNFCVSIVSHNNKFDLEPLLEELDKVNYIDNIILTINTPEEIDNINQKKIKFIRNKKINGFSANHNFAFKEAKKIFASEFIFIVMNPDISNVSNFFSMFFRNFHKLDWDISSPYQLDLNNTPQSFVRVLPNFIDNFLNFFSKNKNFHIDDERYLKKSEYVVGSFMIFKSKVFEKLNGFDENFFMYVEDADICNRALKSNYKIMIFSKNYSINHKGNRKSRKNLRFLIIHIRSLIYFFFKNTFHYEK